MSWLNPLRRVLPLQHVDIDNLNPLLRVCNKNLTSIKIARNLRIIKITVILKGLMMTSSLVLNIRCPESKCDLVDTAGRDAIAAALDGLPGVDILFGYGSHDLPRCRISSSKKTIKIVTLDSDVEKAVMQNLPTILQGLQSRFGAIQLSMTQEDINLKYSAKPYVYEAHGVVLTPSGKQHRRSLSECERINSMSLDERTSLCLSVLNRGILRQADALNIDINEIELPTSVMIVNYAPFAPLFKCDGKAVQHRPVVRLAFDWNAELTGSWHVGSLTGRGHGRIWYTGAGQ